MTNWLDSEDGRAAIEAAARASFAQENDPRYVKWDNDAITRKWHLRVARTDLAAVLALTKPCPTCAENARTQEHPLMCGDCDNGRVPLLVPKEEG